jgi:hypothetical protein
MTMEMGIIGGQKAQGFPGEATQRPYVVVA